MTGILNDDLTIAAILRQSRVIALVGASPDPSRDSHRVMRHLLASGYRVIPVNPAVAGTEILGQRTYASLSDIEEAVDLVDVFRRSAAAGAVVDEAIAIGAKAVWLQLGVIDPAAIARAHTAGLMTVMDRCPRIEMPRLGISGPSHA